MRNPARITAALGFAFFCATGVFSTGCEKYRGPDEAVQSQELKPYTHCTFADGLQIVAVDPLAPGVTARTVETATGKKLVPMLAGIRIMFAYPDTDFFANVKAEKLPASQYSKLKQILIENFDFVLASSPSDRANSRVASLLPGLDVRGLDRDKLEGGTLGFYLIFDDRKQVVVSIYLLNQEPRQRRFQSLGQYYELRNQFLSMYASCIAGNS